MQKQSYEALPIIYRPYNLPVHFPVVAFLGENWIVSMTQPQFLHFHNCIEIGYCVTGAGSIYLNNTVIPFEQGDYSIIYPNTPHIFVSNDKPSKWEYIYFDPFLLLKAVGMSLSDLWQKLSNSPSSPGIIKAEAQPQPLMNGIFREFYNKGPLYQDVVNGLLLSVLAMVEQLPNPESTSYYNQHLFTTIQDVLFYIHEHYSEPISVADLSRLCCLSESHLRRVFKTVTGYSPLVFIQHYRIQQACHYIYQNQESLNMIARLVGFPSLSSFNRQFKQCMHMSPSEWKKICTAALSHNKVISFTDTNTRHIFQL